MSLARLRRARCTLKVRLLPRCPAQLAELIAPLLTADVERGAQVLRSHGWLVLPGLQPPEAAPLASAIRAFGPGLIEVELRPDTRLRRAARRLRDRFTGQAVRRPKRRSRVVSVGAAA